MPEHHPLREPLARVIAATICGCGATPDEHPQFVEAQAHDVADAILTFPPIATALAAGIDSEEADRGAGREGSRVMGRADIEAAAKEKYPALQSDEDYLTYPRIALREFQRAAYIRGRLDQAEADARIAEGLQLAAGIEGPTDEDFAADARARTIAAAIRKGVE